MPIQSLRGLNGWAHTEGGEVASRPALAALHALAARIVANLNEQERRAAVDDAPLLAGLTLASPMWPPHRAIVMRVVDGDRAAVGEGLRGWLDLHLRMVDGYRGLDHHGALDPEVVSMQRAIEAISYLVGDEAIAAAMRGIEASARLAETAASCGGAETYAALDALDNQALVDEWSAGLTGAPMVEVPGAVREPVGRRRLLCHLLAAARGLTIGRAFRTAIEGAVVSAGLSPTEAALVGELLFLRHAHADVADPVGMLRRARGRDLMRKLHEELIVEIRLAVRRHLDGAALESIVARHDLVAGLIVTNAAWVGYAGGDAEVARDRARDRLRADEPATVELDGFGVTAPVAFETARPPAIWDVVKAAANAADRALGDFVRGVDAVVVAPVIPGPDGPAGRALTFVDVILVRATSPLGLRHTSHTAAHVAVHEAAHLAYTRALIDTPARLAQAGVAERFAHLCGFRALGGAVTIAPPRTREEVLHVEALALQELCVARAVNLALGLAADDLRLEPWPSGMCTWPETVPWTVPASVGFAVDEAFRQLADGVRAGVPRDALLAAVVAHHGSEILELARALVELRDVVPPQRSPS